MEKKTDLHKHVQYTLTHTPKRISTKIFSYSKSSRINIFICTKVLCFRIFYTTVIVKLNWGKVLFLGKLWKFLYEPPPPLSLCIYFFFIIQFVKFLNGTFDCFILKNMLNIKCVWVLCQYWKTYFEESVKMWPKLLKEEYNRLWE